MAKNRTFSQWIDWLLGRENLREEFESANKRILKLEEDYTNLTDDHIDLRAELLSEKAERQELESNLVHAADLVERLKLQHKKEVNSYKTKIILKDVEVERLKILVKATD